MFINISNHPSSGWSEKQLTAAQQYGTIQDIPFPYISPAWTLEEVRSLAAEYHLKCLEYREKEEQLVFHIAGEPVFCFILIQLLLKDGFKIFTSTTERVVKEKGNEKTTMFEFVRFREYMLI